MLGVIVIETRNENSVFAYILYFNICFLWGTSNLATKIGVGSLNPTVFASIRFLTAGIAASAVAFALKGRVPRALRQWKILFTNSFLMNFLTNGCVVLSNRYIDSGIVTVLLSAVPIFTTAIDSFVLRRYRIGGRGWIGLFGGLVGIGIIVTFGSTSVRLDLRGIILALLGALIWSAGSLYSRDQFVEGAVVSHVAIQALFASALFYITGKVTGDFVLKGVTASMLTPAFYLAIVDSFLGFMSFLCLLKIWKPTKVCTYAYINPVVALILGAAVLHEELSTGKIFGMITIVISVMLIQKDRTI